MTQLTSRLESQKVQLELSITEMTAAMFHRHFNTEESWAWRSSLITGEEKHLSAGTDSDRAWPLVEILHSSTLTHTDGTTLSLDRTLFLDSSWTPPCWSSPWGWSPRGRHWCVWPCLSWVSPGVVSSLCSVWYWSCSYLLVCLLDTYLISFWMSAKCFPFAHSTALAMAFW